MKKNIPKKNYFILILIIILVVIISLIIFRFSGLYNQNKLKRSYLYNYVNEVNINDIKNILTEPNSELFILVTETNNDDVYKLEKNIMKIIKKYDLRDNFIYIDYTDNEDLDKLNDIFGTKIEKIPALLYYKNGELSEVVDSKDTLFNEGDLQKIIDAYEVE